MARTPSEGRGSVVTDLIVGVTNGVSNIPDAMANALLAGVSPILGLYSLLVGTPVAALTTGSQYMTVAVTAAMAVTVGGALDAVPAAGRDGAIALMTLLVGAFMLLFGLLRGGRLLRFVSNAVMKGFLNGVAVLVIMGQLANFTGFSSPWGIRLVRAVDTFLHVGRWDLATVAVGCATIAIILLVRRTPLAAFDMLIALVAVSALVYFAHLEVPLVSSVSAIPRGLPLPALPDVSLIRTLAMPALAVALIGLVQGGGISKSFANADGTYPEPSRDMVGQGLGNLAAGAFGGMPVGASVSSTALGVTAGARTRLANVVIGVVVAAVLLLLGPLVELVPLAVLAGILIVVGFSAIDIQSMVDVWRASRESAVIMAITLATMLLVPVQYAVLLGAALSAVQHVYASSKDVLVVSLLQIDDGRWAETEPPAFLPSRAVTVVDIYGSVFYAGVELVDALLPSVGEAERPVLVVRLRAHGEIGSTFILMLRRYNEQIRAAGGRLILAGVSERLMRQLRATRVLDELGADNALPATDIVFESTAAAVELGEAWLAARRDPHRP
ncbi:MAG: SulP family inorganic anion transporter [Coriobacteriia bacterium]|nr:SulP family inorganic anion transporter [Coriobacteriia bacterium]